SADHQLRLTLTPRWSLTGGYSYRQTAGWMSPFQFDATDDREQVTGGLQYVHPRGSFALSSGYDFLRRQPTDASAQLTVRPGERATVSVLGRYSFVTARPTYLSANISFAPSERFDLSASARYSFSKMTLERISARFAGGVPGWS